MTKSPKIEIKIEVALWAKQIVWAKTFWEWHKMAQRRIGVKLLYKQKKEIREPEKIHVEGLPLDRASHIADSMES